MKWWTFWPLANCASSVSPCLASLKWSSETIRCLQEFLPLESRYAVTNARVRWLALCNHVPTISGPWHACWQRGWGARGERREGLSSSEPQTSSSSLGHPAFSSAAFSWSQRDGPRIMVCVSHAGPKAHSLGWAASLLVWCDISAQASWVSSDFQPSDSWIYSCNRVEQWHHDTFSNCVLIEKDWFDYRSLHHSWRAC